MIAIWLTNNAGTPTQGMTDKDQVVAEIVWSKGDKDYKIATLTITHNEPYPTPVITLEGPHPGIRLNVYDHKGEPVYTNYRRDEVTK